LFTEEDEKKLAHYGVLGMKWGKRRGRQASSMTDEELKTKIARLSLEATYTKLVANTATQTRGQALASSIMNSLKTTAKKGVSSQVNPVVEKAVANATSRVMANAAAAAKAVKP